MRALTCLLLIATTASERESGVVAHWIFDAAHHSEGAFQPLQGEWAMPNGSPSFIGEGPRQSLLLSPGAPLMVAGAPVPASALSMRGHFGAIKRLAVSVNKGKPLEVDMGPDEMQMIQVDLGKTVGVRQIKITILEFTAGSDGEGAGFSGIELHRL